jgi:hypothetical protein
MAFFIFKLSRWKKTLLSLKFSLRRCGLFAACPDKTNLFHITNLSKINQVVRVESQTNPGKRADGEENYNCSLTARRFN